MLFVFNGVFSELDKFVNNVVGRVGVIVEEYFNVFYVYVKEMVVIIEFVVELGDEVDVFVLKNI